MASIGIAVVDEPIIDLCQLRVDVPSLRTSRYGLNLSSRFLDLFALANESLQEGEISHTLLITCDDSAIDFTTTSAESVFRRYRAVGYQRLITVHAIPQNLFPISKGLHAEQVWGVVSLPVQ
ncbi:uncharacterized protein EV420DRAFT_1763945 [Desarmillaria tabescens]|uniref:Uncharacterized protein n=1 Tax=Armillaria tabescens TaxID=1929756 RepID=A0AA39N5H2_ARMTA|nr:uncharacterized protein EV420DRAFT_1763945 [Desarmillaria tabescens]KAK0458881.1 hypothetical protein EV420DRAFT_1763945 [Desarmillaria tabescens]